VGRRGEVVNREGRREGEKAQGDRVGKTVGKDRPGSRLKGKTRCFWGEKEGEVHTEGEGIRRNEYPTGRRRCG